MRRLQRVRPRTGAWSIEMVEAFVRRSDLARAQTLTAFSQSDYDALVEQFPGLTTTLLHATIDLQVRDEAIARASIPDPSQVNYSNVLEEQDRRETRILEAQDAIILQMEAERSRAAGESNIKREPVETIVLDDTPPPAPARTSTPATPSTLPNWLKRKTPIVKPEAHNTETAPTETVATATPVDRGAITTEGPAMGTAANPAPTIGTTVATTTGAKAATETDPRTPAGEAEEATRDKHRGEDMEVEEVEPPAAEPGTWVFPQVRRDRCERRSRTNRFHRHPVPSAPRRTKSALGWATLGLVAARGAARRK